MRYIKPMKCDEFAQHLLILKPGKTIEFGVDPGCDWPNEVPNVNDVTYWYFARIMHVPEYDSRFILIDYCGGEEAFAIPLNCYSENFDMDDEGIVWQYVVKYFENHGILEGVDDYVFVEMEE